MVLISFALFDEDLGNGIAVEHCCVTEEFTEFVGYYFEVSVLSCSSEGVLEFVVSPAQCSSCIALWLTEHYVVAGIVETARNCITCVAVASPRDSAV